MEYKEIQDLIRLVKKNKITELEIEREDFKIVIKAEKDKKGEQPATIQQVVPPVQYAPQQMPVSQVPAQPVSNAVIPPANSSEATSAENVNPNLVEVKSPMIGTFYRAPGPDKDPFVSIGDSISSGQTICMIEAMKLFNEIEAEMTGKIVKILVEDATPVEFDQPLFLVDPNA